MILDPNHWLDENYKQRMRYKDWTEILLNKQEVIEFKGNPTLLCAKDLKYGVVEVFKDKVAYPSSYRGEKYIGQDKSESNNS